VFWACPATSCQSLPKCKWRFESPCPQWRFFGLGLSGFSNSASFRADKIVAAIRIANFRSSVIGDSKARCREEVLTLCLRG
jgi:hypothetical protein